MDAIIADYHFHRSQARKWARVALYNKAHSNPWAEAAAQAHAHFLWAIHIIS